MQPLRNDPISHGKVMFRFSDIQFSNKTQSRAHFTYIS